MLTAPHGRGLRIRKCTTAYSCYSRLDLDELEISKTRRKKDMHALQDLGVQLVELTAAQLAELKLPERLLDAVIAAKRIRGFEARRRQMQFIGKLMRDTDAAPIAERIAALKMSDRREIARHHEVERWRERLLAEENALTELAQSYPGLDTQQLRTLIRNARKAQVQGRPPHAQRALFRMLRQLLGVPSEPQPARPPNDLA